MFWSFHPLADKQITNTYRNHFSRSYKNRSIRHSPRHKPEAWISFLTSSPTHNYMCTNSTYSWKTRKCAFLFISISFFDGGGGQGRGLGNFFISWPPLSLPVKHVTFSSSTNRNCNPSPWNDDHIDVPNQSCGSWTLFFNALFCFNILRYSRVTLTKTFISQTQFCGFSPLFLT